MAKPKPRAIQIKWTGPQREKAALLQEGKTFDELITLDYSRSIVSKVSSAIKDGQKPPEDREQEPRTMAIKGISRYDF